jgi:hypothetical protein
MLFGVLRHMVIVGGLAYHLVLQQDIHELLGPDWSQNILKFQ